VVSQLLLVVDKSKCTYVIENKKMYTNRSTALSLSYRLKI